MKPIYIALTGVGLVGLFLYSVRRASTLSKPLSSTTPKKPGSRPSSSSSTSHASTPSTSSTSSSSSTPIGGAQIEEDRPRRVHLFPVGSVVNAQFESGPERVKIVTNEPTLDDDAEIKDYVVIAVSCFLPDDLCPSRQINHSDILG